MFDVELHLLGDLWRLAPRSRLVAGPDGTPTALRKRLALPASVKDVLESLGLPHCEVGAVTADDPAGVAVALSEVIAAPRTLVVAPARPRHLADARFLCDQHLGKLARLLRMVGFDTAWERTWLEPEVARRALNEGRVVLSRGRQLLKRKSLDRALLIRSDRPDDQLGEVLTRFRLAGDIRLPGRCSHCNGELVPVAKADVDARIPPLTRRWLDAYHVCRHCDQLYWEGTHILAIKQRLAGILAGLDRTDEPPET